MLGVATTATLTMLAFDKDNDYSRIAKNIDLFCDVVKQTNMLYVDTINIDKHTETAINAYLYNLDPYTEYIPERDQEDFMTISTGEYGGIGTPIQKIKDGKFGEGTYVTGPYEDSPAYNAGLRSGDMLWKINNDTVTSWPVEKVSKTLRGDANTPVTVTIKRPYTADSIHTFDIIRKKIEVRPVPYYGVVRGSVGYISIKTFNEKTGREVKNALTELKANPEVKSIVLDLRDNGGGLVDQAVSVAGLFLPKGTLVLEMKGRLKQSDKVYKTTQEPIDTKIPLAVLINGNSASASEILAGAMQDHDRAVIIGSRSYGKGLVQSTRPISHNGLVKVTIAKYYIPSGRLIQAIDYSHRNADGDAEQVPDSLTTAYKTDHGRIVRDGHGITPDISVEPKQYSSVFFKALSDNLIFDYANRYAAAHPEGIGSIEDFNVTDEMYEDFIKGVDGKKFGYNKACEKEIDKLRKVAEIEGYLNDSTRVAIDNLAKMLHQDYATDLRTNRADISKYIAMEIVDRYYFERGQLIQMLKSDPVMDKAQEMFSKAGEYERILGLAMVAQKASKNTKSSKGKKKK